MFTPVTFSSTLTIIPIHSACVSLNKRDWFIFIVSTEIFPFISTILCGFALSCLFCFSFLFSFFSFWMFYLIQEPKHILIPVRPYSLHTVWVFVFVFFWQCQMTFGILVPWSGTEPRLHTVEMQNPDDWTAREAPVHAVCCAGFCPFLLFQVDIIVLNNVCLYLSTF